MGSGASSIPMNIDKETFRRLSGGTINDAIFDANSTGGIMTRDKLIELANMKDCFLSCDISSNAETERVAKINEALRAKGLITWFNKDRAKENIATEISAAIDKSRSLICFISKGYVEKVLSESPTEHCSVEFHFTLRRKHPNYFIPVIIDPVYLDKTKLPGVFGVMFSDAHLFDFVSDENFDSKIDELYNRVIQISKAGSNQIKNENQPQSILSQVNKSKEEQQFFQWMARSTNIEENRRIIYCASLVKSGVGTVFDLAKMMQKIPNFLISIGFNEYDADQVALAVRDLGLGYNPVRDFDQSLTLESVIFAMKKSSQATEDPSLAESALACVARVAESNRIMPKLLGEAGICEAVLKLMKRNLAHAPSMEYGCLAICKMSENDPNIAQKFSDLTACDDIPRTLRSHLESPKVIINGCQAISILCGLKGNTYKFSNTGTCDVVSRAMTKNSNDPEVIEKCLCAANALVHDNPENVGKFGMAGLCDQITPLLSLHSDKPTVCQEAFKLIIVLAGEPSNREKLGMHQSASAIISSLEKLIDYPFVVKYGCGSISSIIMGNAHNRKVLSEANACEWLKKAVLKYYKDPSLAEYLSKAVFSLVAGSLDNKKKLDGIQSALSNILKDPNMSEQTKKEAHEALKKL